MTLLNFLKASWPPAVVCVIYLFVSRSNQHQNLDWLMHSLGGFSISFFFYQILNFSQNITGKLNGFTHYILTFTLTCTIALFWEFIEFGLSKAYGINIQISLNETMLDLFFGISGAIISIILILIYKSLSKQKST